MAAALDEPSLDELQRFPSKASHPARPDSAADALAAEALFTSLRLRGEEIAQAGLVAGVYVDDKEGGSGGGGTGLPLL